MGSPEPIGPDTLEATLRRLYELAGRAAADSDSYDRGWEAALIQTLAILEELRRYPAGVRGDEWDRALDTMRNRLIALQAGRAAPPQTRPD